MGIVNGTLRQLFLDPSVADGYAVQSVAPEQLARYLGAIIEPDHLAIIYSTLLTLARSPHAQGENQKLKNVLQALRGMKRFKMTEGMLSGSERAWGKELVAIYGL